MKFDYRIPRKLEAVDYTSPQRFRQNKDVRMYTPQISIGVNTLTEIPDHVQRMVTPTGIGGKLIYVYNFTDTALCMIDSRNAIVIIEPLQHSGVRDISNLQGTIVIEVVYHNQDKVISKSSEVYLEARRDAFDGLTLGIPADNLYNSDHVYDTLFTKAAETQRHRYTICKASPLLDRYDGAFYLNDVDIVIGEVVNPSIVWIHPNSDPLLLSKIMPDKIIKKSLDVSVTVNDNHHVFGKAFVNIAGAALEIPVTRDPSQPEGITVWFDVRHTGTRPTFYKFEDQSCPVRIYTNRTDALSGGSPEKLIEQQLLEEKSRLARDKQKYDRDEFERQQRLRQDELNQRLEEQRRQREQQAQDDKRRSEQEKNYDRSERTAFWRKIIVEGTKLIAATASAVVVVVGLYLKHKAS